MKASKIDRNKVKWCPPESMHFKLNIDGSSKGNPGDAGIGVCIRDHTGCVLALKAAFIPGGTNNFAEAYALLEGILLVKELNISYIHIEGDSAIIISACIKRNIDNWQIRYLLEQAWTLIDTFTNFTISHVYREGNRVANHLANMGSSKEELNMMGPNCDFDSYPILKAKILEDMGTG